MLCSSTLRQAYPPLDLKDQLHFLYRLQKIRWYNMYYFFWFVGMYFLLVKEITSETCSWLIVLSKTLIDPFSTWLFKKSPEIQTYTLLISIFASCSALSIANRIDFSLSFGLQPFHFLYPLIGNNQSRQLLTLFFPLLPHRF